MATYAKDKAAKDYRYPLDGAFKRWYANGDPNEEGAYLNGDKDGLWIQYREGIKSREQTFVKGKLNGKYAEYYHGRRRVTGEYLDNKKTGTWIDYRYEEDDPTFGTIPEGNIRIKSLWQQGKLHGAREHYSFKGILYRKETYDNGDKTGSYSEYYVNNGQQKLAGELLKGAKTGQWQSWFEDGMLAASQEFKDDVLHGKSEQYYSNGQLKQQANYWQGKLDGKLSQYFQNGKPQSHEQWVKGQKEGEASYFHNNGKLAEKGTFLRDRKEGLWQTFWTNGEKRTEGSYISNRESGDWNFYDQFGKLIKTEHHADKTAGSSVENPKSAP